MTADVNDLDQARRRLGLSFYDLWVRYIGLGGHDDAFGCAATCPVDRRSAMANTIASSWHSTKRSWTPGTVGRSRSAHD